MRPSGSASTIRRILRQLKISPAPQRHTDAPQFAAMHQCAGQLMTTGAQAEVYADDFIANHLKVIGGGLTYSQLSAKAAVPGQQRPRRDEPVTTRALLAVAGIVRPGLPGRPSPALGR